MAPSTRQHSRARRQGVPQLMHILNAAKLTRLEHVARMPNGSVVKQLLFAEGLEGLGGDSAGHAPRGRIGLWQLCTQVSRPGWRSGFGMG